ncbi:hypothetical protein [Curtobacterium sp. ZW137]|uniref:hypothetical protein n=1 Tax=Curtobacterium sp. ZW137 TaxID=2485104 RepID=UPI000F4B4F40|nr:hypothetical protein [Curtobacterium sp. ZW137]ROP64695.1 hypothetical protein EDF55_1345 [Curtobacterium sp. ZW137]
MHYVIGDHPADALEVDVSEAGPSSLYGTASAKLYKPDGTVAVDFGVLPVLGDGVLHAPFGATSPFTVAGLHEVRVVLTTGTGDTLRSETIATEPVVVEAPDGWHTLDSARDDWRDAPVGDPALFAVLESAKDQCLAFAPAVDIVPARYRQAQLMQARALWNSGHVNSDGALGGGDLTVTVFPMDWTVKNLLRPKRAIGAIF